MLIDVMSCDSVFSWLRYQSTFGRSFHRSGGYVDLAGCAR